MKMVNNDKDILILTLLLISKGEPLNNSYKISRILEWQFHFIEVKKILDQIKNTYANFDIKNGVHYYKLTHNGKKLITENYDNTLKSLLLKYPNDAETINALYSAFSQNGPNL